MASSSTAIRFRWLNLLFAHWPIDVNALRPLVPEPLEIDTFEGSAWVGLVPFTMRDVRHRWLPPMPTMHHFHECNVRTYVSYQGEPGVWFFSLDAASRLAVWGARTLWHLNYKYAKIDLQHDGDVVRYAVDRVDDPPGRLHCVWQAGDQMPRSQPGDLAYFLTERYMLYSARRRDGDSWKLFRGRINHDPWPLRNATLHELDDTLVAAAGIDVGDQPPPVLYHVDELAVTAQPLQRL